MKALIKQLYVYATLVLSLVSNQISASKTIDLTDPNQLLVIGKDISYLEDPSGNLAIQDVLTSENQQNFIEHNKEVFSRPGTESAFWFKVVVQNYTDEDAWLEVGSNYAWYIDFYSPDTLGKYSEPIETGTMRPKESKLYDVNFFWLPVNKANQSVSKTYYIRVTSGLTYELPLQVGTIRSLSKNKYANDYLTAGFIGIVLIMLLYNLFIYISIKDHVYLYYLGYLFLMIFSMPYANGYPFIENVDIFFLDYRIWNKYFLVWHSPAYYFAGAFCIHYLDLKNKGPWLRRLIHAEILILAGVFPLLNLAGFQFVQLVNPVQVTILIFYLTCLASGYYFVFKGLKQAQFYALGWTFLITGAFIFFAVINGFLPFNPLTRNALYFGVAIEVGLFALALANRLNELRRAKEIAEEENIKLIREQNEELEKKVQIRTKELEEANEELVQSNEELLVTTEKLDVQSRELQEVNKAKDRLFAIVSHDLRSPISSLKGILDLMYKGRISREEFLKFSIDAKHSVEHAHFMLNNLLTWSKFQLQGMTTTPEEIVVKRLIDENVDFFADTINKKSIMIINNTRKDANANADPNHINIIIRNLLSNALKFTETGGKVTIDAKLENEMCVISISDTGVGIPEELLEGIFTIKSSKSNVGTEGEKGTGLGLPLCKDFAEKNKGSISVESIEGEGSTFYIRIPNITK